MKSPKIYKANPNLINFSLMIEGGHLCLSSSFTEETFVTAIRESLEMTNSLLPLLY